MSPPCLQHMGPGPEMFAGSPSAAVGHKPLSDDSGTEASTPRGSGGGCEFSLQGPSAPGGGRPGVPRRASCTLSFSRPASLQGKKLGPKLFQGEEGLELLRSACRPSPAGAGGKE